MEHEQSQDDYIAPCRSQELVPLRSVAVSRSRERQIVSRRPLVMGNDGIIWQADEEKYWYRDKSSGKHFCCSWSIEGGVLIVRDHLGTAIEGYKLRDGEIIETI